MSKSRRHKYESARWMREERIALVMWAGWAGRYSFLGVDDDVIGLNRLRHAQLVGVRIPRSFRRYLTTTPSEGR